MLLEGSSNGRFTRSGETSKPDCKAGLAAEGGAFGVGEGVGVPGDIAGESSGEGAESGLEGLPTLPLSRLRTNMINSLRSWGKIGPGFVSIVLVPENPPRVLRM